MKPLQEALLSPNAGAAISQLCDSKAITWLQELVIKNWGFSTRQLRQKSGLSQARFYRAFGALARAGLVVSVRRRNAQLVFPFLNALDNHSLRVALLSNPNLLLHDWLLQAGIRSRAEVLQQAKTWWGWSERTTERRLASLVKDGLVVVNRNPAAASPDGRTAWLQALPLPTPPKNQDEP